MNKCIKSIISSILVLSLLITSTNFSYAKTTLSEYEINILRENFNSMPQNQKELFLSEIKKDDELYLFHVNNIDDSMLNDTNDNITFFMNGIIRNSANRNIIEQVRIGLKALNLPTPVYYSFVTFASSLGAAIADGPLPIGDILLLGSGVIGCIIVGWYWDSISYKVSGIVSVFRSAFGYTAGKAMSKMLSTASLAEEVDVSDNPGWTEVDGESEVLDDVNGEIGQCDKGRDGTVKKEVKDKDTGEVIGEIHIKQPQKGNNGGTNTIYTGKKFPSHYHDLANRLGKGYHHWYWK